jgi:hypothetical protein
MYISRRPVIYVGYDPKEHVAFEVLKYSIEKYTHKYDVIPLEQSSLRISGLYKRTYYLDEERQQRDTADNRPFSSEFTFTRFLIPFINLHKGLALFMDCDMFLRADITEVFDEYGQFDEYAVSVVKHDYKPKEIFKMDNQIQSRWLHNFSWLEDKEIGSIHPKWNFLDGWTDENINPCNVHFTTGGPWFEDWKPKRLCDAHYAGEWDTLHNSYNSRILPKEN